MLKKLNELPIKKRLTRAFVMLSAALGGIALVTAIIMTIMSNQYSAALEEYGFAQGDMGRSMTTFAEIRSATRAAIGYEDASAIAEVVKVHDEKLAEFNASCSQLEAIIVTDEEQEYYNSIIAEIEEYLALDAQIIELGATEDQDLCRQAQDMALNQLSPKYDEIVSDMQALMDIKVTEGDSISKTLSLIDTIFTIAIIVLVGITVACAMTLGNVIAKNIADPLEQLGARLRTFASGDLDSPFPEVEIKDEVADMIYEAARMSRKLNLIITDMGELLSEMAQGNYAVSSKIPDNYTGGFQQMLLSMRQLRDQMTTTLRSIEDASGYVSSGSANLADASQCLAEGATEQAGAVEELQATIISLTEIIEQSAKSAEGAYEMTSKYAQDADSSRQEMSEMVAAMERINETSAKIENIISEIESIASQTNLLSLNASIEAARAGEAGRGFAVVADQIRQLAEQSTKSAADTRELIEGTLQEIEAGNRAAERAATAIEGVVNGMQEIARSAKESSEASASQAVMMHQAEEGVGQIAEVVQSNSATAQEASATSQELSAQATALDGLINQFRLL